MNNKEINTIFVKELEELPEEELLNRLYGDNDLLKKFKENLYKYEFITYKNNSFVFSFVGVILFGDLVIYCYPKYIKTTDNNNFKRKIKDVLKVIMKANKKKSFSYEYDESEDIPYNKLPLSLFFLEDYYENGLYSKVKDQIEINGNGEINWDITINDSIPILDSEDYTPYYTDLKTNVKINEIKNYFRLLHECIITDCSNFLEKYDLIELFDLTPIELSEKTIKDDYDDIIAVSKKINKELNIEFNTHKRNLLMLMRSYISEENSFTEEDTLTMYGTRKFEHVWEDVCKEVLDDKLDVNIEKLELSSKKKRYDKKLKEIIKKPKWYYGQNKELDNIDENDKDNIEKSGWIPDLVTFYNDYFIILDAKYYDIQFEKTQSKLILKNSPGIESVSKQYFYELSFKDFYQTNGFVGSKNAFLFPTDGKYFENKGHVEITVLKELKFYDEFNHEEQQQLEDIQVLLLPAETMYDHYLKDKTLEKSKLKIKGIN